MTHQATVPAYAAGYFGISARPALDHHPVIDATFTPARGWRPYPIRKRVSGAAIRRLRAEGVTHVTLALGERRADFTIAELSR